MAVIYFGLMRLLKVHRVPLSAELMGYDIVDHGHLSKRFLEKIRHEQAVEDLINASTGGLSLVPSKTLKTEENFLSGKNQVS